MLLKLNMFLFFFSRGIVNAGHACKYYVNIRGELVNYRAPSRRCSSIIERERWVSVRFVLWTIGLLMFPVYLQSV